MSPGEPGEPETPQHFPRVRYTDRILLSAWNSRVQRAVAEAWRQFGGPAHVTLHSYDSHGASGYAGDLRKGDSASFDVYVTGYNKRPTRAQKKLNWQVALWATRNWKRLGVRCVIANGWINTFDGRGWRRYNPRIYKKWGDANWPTKIHTNHCHIRVLRDTAGISTASEEGLEAIEEETHMQENNRLEGSKPKYIKAQPESPTYSANKRGSLHSLVTAGVAYVAVQVGVPEAELASAVSLGVPAVLGAISYAARTVEGILDERASG